MESMILNALAPVFFVMFLGYFAGRRRLVDNINVANLNVLVMTFALPAALFTAISRTPQRVIIENGKLMLVLTLAMLIIFVVELLLQYRVFRVEPGKAAVQTLTVALPNYASVGLPLLGSVFGPQSALSVAVAIAVGAVTVTPLTLVLLENASAKDASESPVRRFFKATVKSLRRPIFWAPMLGVIMALSNVPMPDVVGRMLNLIGQATAGAALFLTGVILSAQRLRINLDVITGVLLKNVLQPLLAWGILRLVVVPEPIAGQAILLIAIPAGFFGVVFGVGYGVRSEEAGSTLIASSIFAAISLAVTIMFVAPG